MQKENKRETEKMLFEKFLAHNKVHRTIKLLLVTVCQCKCLLMTAAQKELKGHFCVEKQKMLENITKPVTIGCTMRLKLNGHRVSRKY